uniref:Putative lipocalin n=1 Tax=Ixodes ricinus TaxID=34613 RepID=A0A6B0V7K8_IXORI
MNPLCWSSCLWLWFMCTGVECLPKFHLSSRDQDDNFPDVVAVTMNYILDETVGADDQEYVKAWLLWITQMAMVDFQTYFQFTLNISYITTYLADQNELKSWLNPYKEPSLWPHGAISALAGYFRDKNHSDIICLVTKERLSDGFGVRNGYGYSEQQPICKDGLPILLAYVPGHEGYSFHMLLRLILDSILLGDGQHVFNIPSNKHTEVRDFLRTCKNGREDGSTPISPSGPLPPPQPPAPPSEPGEPVPSEEPPTGPEPPQVPDETSPTPPPPGPPPPPEPAPQPEPPATTTTTETPVPDYC